MEQEHLELTQRINDKNEEKERIGERFIAETNVLKADFNRLGMGKAWEDIVNDPVWKTMVCKMPNQYERQDECRDMFVEKYATHVSPAISCLADMCLQWYSLSCEINDLVMRKTQIENDMEASKAVSVGQLYSRIETLTKENKLLQDTFKAGMDAMRILYTSEMDKIRADMRRYVWDTDIHLEFESEEKEGGLIHWLGTQGLRYNYVSPLANGTIGIIVHYKSVITKHYHVHHESDNFFSKTGYDLRTPFEPFQPYPYVIIDIGNHRRMKVTTYTLKYIVPPTVTACFAFLQNWVFEASNDLTGPWTILRNHHDDPTFSKSPLNKIVAFEIADNYDNKTEYFRYFRVRQTHQYCQDTFYLGGFNLFGDLRIVNCM